MGASAPAPRAPPLDRYWSALLALGGFVVLVSTIAGLVQGSLVYALNVAGAIGVYGLLISYGLLRLVNRSRHTKAKHRPYLEYGTLVVGAALALGFFLVWPPTPEENDGVNLLTFFGIAFAVGFFLLSVHTLDRWRRESAPALKQCPDCAEKVLAAARVCKYCGFRFEPPL